MSAYLDFTESQATTVLRGFLLAQLPAGIEVVKGQINRVGEPLGLPKSGDFVVITPILRTRLATNSQTYIDAIFTGSVAGTTLTVSALQNPNGPIMVGAPLANAADTVAAGTYIVAQLTGQPGQAGDLSAQRRADARPAGRCWPASSRRSSRRNSPFNSTSTATTAATMRRSLRR